MAAPTDQPGRFSLGIDILEIKRLQGALKRQGERFLKRVFTRREIDYCRRRKLMMLPELAGRFAAKEAVMKALGTGRRGVAWRDIEVTNEPSGRPLVHLTGGAAKKFQELGGRAVEISLTHEKNVAAAVALIEAERR